MKKIIALILLLVATILVACAAGSPDQPVTEMPAVNTDAPAIAQPAPTTTPAPSDPVPSRTGEPLPEADEQVGRLYTVGFIDQKQHLLVFDLASGELSRLFDVPEDAWLSEVAVSPDGANLLLAYAPPPESAQVQFGFTALYTMPADGSGEPELLIPQADPSETFFNISWPLDDTIYYAHYALSIGESGEVIYASQIERARLPAAEAELLVQDAAWPRLSNDGARLAYVTEADELVISEPDGTSPERLLGPEHFSAVDAPLFSLDDHNLYFSAVDLEPGASLSPLEKLLGVKVAQAHSVPSDWWRLPLTEAAQAERLTSIDKIGLYGDFDASGRHLFFVAADGLYVMGPAGEAMTQLQNIPAIATIDWTP